MVILRLIEYKLDKKYPIEQVINSLRNTTAIHLKQDVYHQKSVNNIIKDLSNIFDLDLFIKFRTLTNVKKILKK